MTKRNELIGIALYVLIFGVLFLVYPLQGEVPGNCDTYLWLSLWRSFGNDIGAFFTSAVSTNSMYPAEHIYSFGEFSFINALIFNGLQLIGSSDLWAYYGVLVLIFSANASAVYYLSSHFISGKVYRWLAGFLFAFCNFHFANIDTSVALSFYPAILSLYWLFGYQTTRSVTSLYKSWIALAFSLYCSLYVFLIFLPVVILTSAMSIGKKKHLAQMALPIISAICLAIPFILYYWQIPSEGANSAAPAFLPLDYTSLQPEHWTQWLPGNWMYGDGSLPSQEELPWWSFTRRSAFMGWMLYISGIVALLANSLVVKKKIWLIVVVLMGILASTRFGETDLLGFLYQNVSGYSFFRVPLRAYVLVVLALAIGSALLWERWLGAVFTSKWLLAPVVFLSLLHLAENLSWPMPSTTHFEPNQEMLNYLDKQKEGTVVLHLPASEILSMVGDEYPLFPYGREAVYMYYQSHYQLKTLNGVNGYLPQERITVQKEIDYLPYRDAFERLGKARPDVIIYHKRFKLPQDKPNLLKRLKASQLLDVEMETDELAIFKVKGTKL